MSYKHFPKQRRLDSSTLADAEKLLKLKCNKVLLSHLQNVIGKDVTGCDISNMKGKISAKTTEWNDVEKLVEKLQEK